MYELLIKGKRKKLCEQKITNVLQHCADGLKLIEREFPDSGIGDTQTDEEIVAELYDMIH